MMVERRDQVLMTFFDFCVACLATFLMRWSSTNGPFLTERAMVEPYSCSTPSCRGA